MAAFKNKENGTWYVQFRYTDWRGERQQKLKRGFSTKKAALAWEREFLMQKQADLLIGFSTPKKQNRNSRKSSEKLHWSNNRLDPEKSQKIRWECSQ